MKDNTRITLASPNDIVATLPYLVGEPPTPGLVVLTLHGSRPDSVACCDLNRPGTGDPFAFGEKVTTHAVAEGCDTLIVVGYGTDDQVGAHIEGIVGAARRCGLPIPTALRVHDGRYWSPNCKSPDCCPPEGTPIDPAKSTGPAEAVLRGATPDAPLSSVVNRFPGGRRRLAPSGAVRPETVAATAAAEAETELLRQNGVQALYTFGAAAVREAIEAERTGTGPHSVEKMVRLAVVLRGTPVRDIAWKEITPETARAHLDLWSRITCAAAPADRAAPASLIAVAAWMLNDLPLAQAGLDTALSADPRYPMARLIQQALDVGMPAERWVEWVEGRNHLD